MSKDKLPKPMSAHTKGVKCHQCSKKGCTSCIDESQMMVHKEMDNTNMDIISNNGGG